jgi:glycosyltransferase involved in cell wall biosynthesis
VRVALLTYNAQAGDAIGNQVAEKLGFFLERGADVRVFLKSDARLHPAVRPHCQVLRGAEPCGARWELLSSADLVIVEYGQYYPLLEWLPLLADGKPRILFDYHGVTPADFWGAQNREALEMGMRQRGLVWCADAALVHSHFTWEELHRPTHFPREYVSVLEYPVDIKRFCPGRPQRRLQDRLGLNDVCLILFVGRLAPNKRVTVLIEALHRLRDLRPPVHLAIVGDDTDVYQVEASRCQQRATELGLAARVHFLGHVREEQLLDAYRSADLFVMPSRHEGFCIPVIEAMACGLPVVAAQAGALPETVAGAGLTFTADDPDDLARQVRRVFGCGNPRPGNKERESQSSGVATVPLEERLRQRGLRRAAEHERSAWRERFGRIVEELLHNPSRQKRSLLEVRPRTERRVVCAGSETVLIPVGVVNRGTNAAPSEGPGRVLLRSMVSDERGPSCGLPALETPLPELLVPGQETTAALRVPVPTSAGTYRLECFPEFPHRGDKRPELHKPDGLARDNRSPLAGASGLCSLIVEPASVQTAAHACAAPLQAMHRALVEAETKQHLPVDYLDVTQGFLARWKAWIKRKLLGNFKHAYVDVLSRQQSAFNRQTLTALRELTECCALLAQLDEARQRVLALEARVARLEKSRSPLSEAEIRHFDAELIPAMPAPAQGLREESFASEPEAQDPAH